MTTDTVLTDEQREDLYLAYLEPDMPGDEGDAIIKTIEQAVLQSPEVQAWKSDAERFCGIETALDELHKNGALPYVLEGYLP